MSKLITDCNNIENFTENMLISHIISVNGNSKIYDNDLKLQNIANILINKVYKKCNNNSRILIANTGNLHTHAINQQKCFKILHNFLMDTKTEYDDRIQKIFNHYFPQNISNIKKIYKKIITESGKGKYSKKKKKKYKSKQYKSKQYKSKQYKSKKLI